MPRLASISQPNGQELHWVQRPALRKIGAPLAPIAAAPSIASWPLRPIRSGSSWVTWRNSSASPKSASRSCAHSIPKRVRQSSSTGSGARKQVPELITVVPPTTRATGTGIGGHYNRENYPSDHLDAIATLYRDAGLT